MPERKIILVDIDYTHDSIKETFAEDQLETVRVHLNVGWVLDPLFQSKPIKLDNAVIYHLIKYTPEELELMTVQEETLTEPEIVSMRSVGYDEVDALIAEGYKPAERYAKNVTMIKYREPEQDASSG